MNPHSSGEPKLTTPRAGKGAGREKSPAFDEYGKLKQFVELWAAGRETLTTSTNGRTKVLTFQRLQFGDVFLAYWSELYFTRGE